MMSGWIAADAMDRDAGGRGMVGGGRTPAAARRRAARRRMTSKAGRRETPRDARGAPVASATLAFFNFMFTRFFAQAHARACASRTGACRETARAARRLVVFANHPSWWDGVAFMLLSAGCCRTGRMFTRWTKRRSTDTPSCGASASSGSRPARSRGAVAFLRTAEHVLAGPAHMLWMNAPGRFADVRERPVPDRAGHDAPAGDRARRASSCRSRSTTRSGPSARRRCWSPSARRSRPRSCSRWTATRARRACPPRWRRRWTAWPRMPSPATPAASRRWSQGREGMGGVYQAWRRLGAAAARPALRPPPRPGRPEARAAWTCECTWRLDRAGAGRVAGRRSGVMNLSLLPRPRGHAAGGHAGLHPGPRPQRGGEHRRPACAPRSPSAASRSRWW